MTSAIPVNDTVVLKYKSLSVSQILYKRTHGIRNDRYGYKINL